MPTVLQDLRYGARVLLKNRALTVISVLALTLGIGFTTAMFSIVYGVLLRGLPFERPDRIAHLERSHLSRGISSMEVSIRDYVDWRDSQRSFEGLGAFYEATMNVSGAERAERFEGAYITPNAFRLVRATPLLGRTFREGEELPGADPVVLLGYRLWQDRFAGDPAVVGQTVRVNGVVSTIVGVMPERFAFPVNQALWAPLRLDPLAIPRGEGQTVEVFGRLRDGVALEDAAVEMASIAKRLALEYPKSNEGVATVVKPYTEEYVGEEESRFLYTMLGAVFFVLLIACANVANLLLGRAAARTKEVGIRTALGASRARVIRQFLAEALLLAVAGAVLGLGVAYVGVQMFNSTLAAVEIPFWIEIKLDVSALLFSLALTLLAAAVAGAIPALQAARADVNEILKDESRGSSSFRMGWMSKSLVVAEIALSCGLLVGAGLTIKSVVQLRNLDYPFRTTDILTARMGLPEARYASDTAQVRFWEELLSRLQSTPGIVSVALASDLPALGSGWQQYAAEGVAYATEDDYPAAHSITVTPAFYSTLGVRLREGRAFTPQDRAASLPVTIVNESFARRQFGDASALGRRIRPGGADSRQEWLTIVGVVPDLMADEVDDESPAALYLPMAQNGLRFMSIVARTRGNPEELAPALREAVAALDSDLPLFEVRSLARGIAEATWFYRVFGAMFMIFGSVALFLASVGLYGVMAFSVSRRTRELGVRMAIGASARNVIAMIFRQGFTQLGIGMALGLALAVLVSQGIAIILYDVNPRDPVIFAGVALVLLITGVAACLVPARRATRVDPMIALRNEG